MSLLWDCPVQYRALPTISRKLHISVDIKMAGSIDSEAEYTVLFISLYTLQHRLKIMKIDFTHSNSFVF